MSSTTKNSYLCPKRDRVIITGGAGGLGQSIATILLNKHIDVIIVDINIPDPGDGLYLNQARYVSANVANSDPNSLLVGAGIDPKTITAVVLCAAIMKQGTLKSISMDEVSDIIDINLKASYLWAHAFLKYMIPEKRGTIVFVSSTLGFASPAMLSAYASTKSAIISLHESLTEELRNSKVRSLLLICGQMSSQMFAHVETPSSAIAPILRCDEVAKRVVETMEYGYNGQRMFMPTYARFMPLLRLLPDSFITFARFASGMDRVVYKSYKKSSRNQGKKPARENGNVDNDKDLQSLAGKHQIEQVEELKKSRESEVSSR